MGLSRRLGRMDGIQRSSTSSRRGKGGMRTLIRAQKRKDAAMIRKYIKKAGNC